MESAKAVHVAFGESIAATMREALSSLGLSERVIGLPDALNVGPIDPPDPHVRQAWGKSVLRVDPMLRDGLVDDPAKVQEAWAGATAPGIHPVFWACLASPAEHACFLAFAASMGDRPFDLVDATDIGFTTVDGHGTPRSLGAMRMENILASDLPRRRRPVPAQERIAASKAWALLRRENAPFRVVRDGRLVSAPLTHYDALLVGQASEDWDVAARVIGRTMEVFERGRGGDATGDVVLFGRLLALAEDGVLEVVRFLRRDFDPVHLDQRARRDRLGGTVPEPALPPDAARGRERADLLRKRGRRGGR